MVCEFEIKELKKLITSTCSKNICYATKEMAISCIASIQSKLKDYELYKEYSYYVGGELTCGKRLNKYCKWLSERKT